MSYGSYEQYDVKFSSFVKQMIVTKEFGDELSECGHLVTSPCIYACKMGMCTYFYRKSLLKLSASFSHTVLRLCSPCIMLHITLRVSERGRMQAQHKNVHRWTSGPNVTVGWFGHWAFPHSFVTQRNMNYAALLFSLSLYLSFTLSFVCLMASIRRFGSCSSCKLRNVHKNGNERRRKCHSAVPEWLLGSRIKAQGEDGGDGKMGAPKTRDTRQAGGVCSFCPE